jgi:hypothetical protein
MSRSQIYRFVVVACMSLWVGIFAEPVRASTCQHHLGLARDFNAHDQVVLLQRFARQHCDLISIRFQKQSVNATPVESHLILDFDAQMLVRSMRGRGPTRFYVWHGVDRSRLLKTAAAQGFSGFSFVGRAPRHRLTQRMLQHVR